MKLRSLGCLALALSLAAAGCAPANGAATADEAPVTTSSAGQEEVLETFEVVREHPHDAAAFTQGLTYHDGYLYEGTGRRGQSSLRRVDIETGRVVQQADLSPVLFGEGITLHDGRLFQLTWTSGVGFVYDLETFEVADQFRQFTQGWGLTSDGESLIQSDGTVNLYFVDPETMQPSRSIQVHDANGFIDRINELEYIDGDIYANVWHSWEILRISPRDGRVIGRVDLSGIFDADSLPDPESVLNGIAYDPDTGRIWVTGKLWPKLFEVRFVRR
jgi:glutamine cyclotransferase